MSFTSGVQCTMWFQHSSGAHSGNYTDIAPWKEVQRRKTCFSNIRSLFTYRSRKASRQLQRLLENALWIPSKRTCNYENITHINTNSQLPMFPRQPFESKIIRYSAQLKHFLGLKNESIHWICICIHALFMHEKLATLWQEDFSCVVCTIIFHAAQGNQNNICTSE